MKVAHLTTVDLSLRFLVFPQLLAARQMGMESIGISASGPDVAELEAEGIRHIALTSSTRGVSLTNDVRAAIQLWRILRRERIEILHTHNPKPGVYGRILGRLAGVPIVINTIHGLYATEDDPGMKRALVYGLETLAAQFSHHELAQNPEDVARLRRLPFYPSHKLTLLGNGVDLSRFDPHRASVVRESMRAELGVGDDQVVVGMVGRLVAEKGYPEFFEAARRLVGQPVVFLAVGPDDPSKADALDRAKIEEAIRSGVRFLGMRTDVDRLYGAFDIFVLPSHREGFPRAAMEAAACGLPIVATDIRGCRQVVDDGASGLLVPVNDPVALTNAISQLVADSELRSKMGEAAHVKARNEFDERIVVAKVLDAYQAQARRRGITWPPSTDLAIRPGRLQDRHAVAQLHAAGIETGFLSTLGPGFLALLYRALIGDHRSQVLVAEVGGKVVGFVAGTEDTRAFYREFARRYAIPAGLQIAANLRRGMVSRIRETRSYGVEGHHEVAAELLSMVVAPAARGQGLAHRLGVELQNWARQRHLGAMKVVVGADNEKAIGVYRRLGFGDDRRIEVHQGQPSLELVWRA
jgi:glycosyltransferase involved in cell wall biosynthesis/ribosomal protein S18 acetylase RimI-like enzyme